MNERPLPVLRDACPEDVDKIYDLLADFAREHLLLPRTKEDILARIGNFHIIEKAGEFAGCAALRDYGSDLYEVRSLAICRNFNNAGLGSFLVSALIEKMRISHPGARLFALTYRADFFCRLGFQIVEKSMFPEKIWCDCSTCPKFHNCDETAVLFQV